MAEAFEVIATKYFNFSASLPKSARSSNEPMLLFHAIYTFPSNLEVCEMEKHSISPQTATDVNFVHFLFEPL